MSDPYWKNGVDAGNWEYRERIEDGYREYKLDIDIAKRIIELRKTHSWRALAIKVTGVECQITGKDLERLACWTLGLEVE